jgi:hypothetical protein
MSTVAEVVTDQMWLERAQEFIKMRLGLAGAEDHEFVVGYVDGFKPVFATPKRYEGESWYVWFVFPDGGKAARVVSKLMPGLYCDHEGNVYEYNSKQVVVLGTVTRIGSEPLLSMDMLRKGEL